MTTLHAIKTAIAHLSDEERHELRTWYEQLDAEQWDAQIEQDVAAGRLDLLDKVSGVGFQVSDRAQQKALRVPKL
ncbi:MAG: hypothetical protein WCG26_00620 [Chloroflexales bacterium]